MLAWLFQSIPAYVALLPTSVQEMANKASANQEKLQKQVSNKGNLMQDLSNYGKPTTMVK